MTTHRAQTPTREEIAEIVEGCARALRFGCGDGGCRIQKPGGQHTNGGCRCGEIAGTLLDMAALIEQAGIGGRSRR